MKGEWQLNVRRHRVAYPVKGLRCPIRARNVWTGSTLSAPRFPHPCARSSSAMDAGRSTLSSSRSGPEWGVPAARVLGTQVKNRACSMEGDLADFSSAQHRAQETQARLQEGDEPGVDFSGCWGMERPSSLGPLGDTLADVSFDFRFLITPVLARDALPAPQGCVDRLNPRVSAGAVHSTGDGCRPESGCYVVEGDTSQLPPGQGGLFTGVQRLARGPKCIG
jgi:hypothetical protein